jgi:hypothetical protein
MGHADAFVLGYIDRVFKGEEPADLPVQTHSGPPVTSQDHSSSPALRIAR